MSGVYLPGSRVKYRIKAVNIQFFHSLFKAGILLYFAASAFVFFDKYTMAGLCTILAFGGTVIAILGFFIGIMNIAQAKMFFDILHMLKINLWLYVGINFVVLGYAVKYI